MAIIGNVCKASLLLLSLTIYVSAQAAERVVVRTERRWVEPRYEMRVTEGQSRRVIVHEGYWENAPIYRDEIGVEPRPVYAYSVPYYYGSSEYSYTPYWYGGYPYYNRVYGSGLIFGARFVGGCGHCY